MNDITKKPAIGSSTSRREKVFKTIPVNTAHKIAVKIDSKTTVYADDEAHAERIKTKYANRK